VMSLRRLSLCAGLIVLGVGCNSAPTSQDTCAASGVCAPAPSHDSVACSSDLDCPGGLCSSEGLCIQTSACFVTSECPIDRYCNNAMAVPVCAPLPAGSCREDSQCGDLRCSALAGGLGACVECLAHGDCGSGMCGMDGSCAEQAATQAADCPANAHHDGDVCVCDEGFALDVGSGACSPATSAAPASTPEAAPDHCAEAGRYDDGACDIGCPQPDPDCEAASADICEENGWYSDGICDEECAEPDPDCGPSGGDPCGGETFYGRCEGDVLIYCDEETVYYVDCYANGDYCDLYSVEEGYYCIIPA